jgi:hypothetical protein
MGFSSGGVWVMVIGDLSGGQSPARQSAIDHCSDPVFVVRRPRCLFKV